MSDDIRLLELLETDPEESHPGNALPQLPTTGIQSLK